METLIRCSFNSDTYNKVKSFCGDEYVYVRTTESRGIFIKKGTEFNIQNLLYCYGIFTRYFPFIVPAAEIHKFLDINRERFLENIVALADKKMFKDVEDQLTDTEKLYIQCSIGVE